MKQDFKNPIILTSPPGKVNISWAVEEGGGAADSNSETKNSPTKNMPIYFYFSLGVQNDTFVEVKCSFSL